MERFEDVLTRLMLIGATVITAAIVAVGAYAIFSNVNFIPVTLLFSVAFLALYTLRNIYIGLGLIVHGRYRDERR